VDVDVGDIVVSYCT